MRSFSQTLLLCVAFGTMVAVSGGDAFAAEPMTLTIENTSARTVSSFAVYAMDQNTGAVVEDNLGVMIDPLAPGDRYVLRLSLTLCQKVFLRGMFEGGEEVTGTTDLCRNRTMLMKD